jgi:hypothetical protein
VFIVSNGNMEFGGKKMKKVSKILLAILALAMLLMAAACGGGANNQPGATGPAFTTVEPGDGYKRGFPAV